MSLRLPLILWTQAPKHHITSITSNRNATEVYTGTTTGLICKWTVNPFSQRCVQNAPQFVMIPSSCSAVLSMCLVISHDIQFLVSSLTFISPSVIELLFVLLFGCLIQFIQIEISIFGIPVTALYSHPFLFHVCSYSRTSYC